MHGKIKQLLADIQKGDYKSLARGITMVENELPGYELLLLELTNSDNKHVIGITGPPGAGKSTLVNSLLHYWLGRNKKVAVIAVDPSSPFNYGALLGDRVRMSEFYTHPNIYIRSLATRGALGGLNAKIIEVTDLAKAAPFDIILVETVGVGQSEVEIAGLADCTIVTLVPEGGDQIQTLKAGIMEIADIFVVNKADRPMAEGLYRNLRILAHEKATDGKEIPVIKTIATKQNGIDELADSIDSFFKDFNQQNDKRLHLLTEKSWQLIQARRMAGIERSALNNELSEAVKKADFNIYRFAGQFNKKHPDKF